MKIIIADNFKDKLLGLMLKKNINYGLLLKNCKSIHTFFMLENIDVLLLNKDNKILNIKRNIKPNKVLIFHTQNKTNILELPSNNNIDFKINDIIDLKNM